MNIKNISKKLNKINKLNKFAILFFIGCGILILSGCAGTNRQLEKDHIMNNGCFITCRNNIKIERPPFSNHNKIAANKKINGPIV
ncbi:MAG: hypothetical protein M1407_00530 [Deltaproteobacteria bacterium]|nr:hypothetical protein [Deltaproteobacteria bacterium]